MKHLLWSVLLAGLLVTVPAWANNPNGPGACDPRVTSDDMTDQTLSRYCKVIRQIRDHLIAGRAEQVLALQPQAQAAADAIVGRRDRAKARDEVRVAVALAHERAGSTGRALSLIAQSAESSPDITAFPRGLMLARRDRPQQAAAELERAVRDMPGWANCSLIRTTIDALRAGRPVGNGIDPATTMGLPSTVWYTCHAKAALGPMPPSLTTHVDFALSRSEWPAAEARKLDEMEASIRADSSHQWLWIVAGHADQSCFPRNCAAENLRLSHERADAVAMDLRRRIPERAGDIQVRAFGMTDPLIDRPGKQEAANRRADLLATARTVAEPPSAACPGTVTVYEAGVSAARRRDGGIPATLELRPRVPTPVSRGSGFTIAFRSDNPDFQHFYAWSANAEGSFNLGQMGAVPSGRLSDLRKLGGRLPAITSAVPGRPMAFRIGDDTGSAQEIIHLVASSLPVPEIEQELAGAPLVTTTADATTLTLPKAARALSKGIFRPDWEPAEPNQPGQPGELRVETSPPAPPVHPAKIVPHQLACSFILTWR